MTSARQFIFSNEARPDNRGRLDMTETKGKAGDTPDAFQERLPTMRRLLTTVALLLSGVCAHGQTVQQKAATKTLARKGQAQCDAETPRVARTLTAAIRGTRVYAVFYSPKFSKCLAAVYLPLDRTLVAASLLNLDPAAGTQHIVWEDVFPKAFDAISALDVQIDKLSK
jgi:hypothetical protein